MKTGFNKLTLAVVLALFAAPAWAVGSIIAAAIFQGIAVSAFVVTATAFVINMVVSAIITKAFFTPEQPGGLSGD